MTPSTDSTPSRSWWPSFFSSSPARAASVHEPTEIERRTSEVAASCLSEKSEVELLLEEAHRELGTILAVPAGIGAIVAYGYARVFPEATSTWIRYALQYGAGVKAQNVEDAGLVQENLQKVSDNFLELVGIKAGGKETTLSSNLLELAIGSSKLFGAGHGAILERDWAIDRKLWIEHIPKVNLAVQQLATPLAEYTKKEMALREKEAAYSAARDAPDTDETTLQRLENERNIAVKEEKQARDAYNNAQRKLVEVTGQSLGLLMPALSNWLTDKTGRDSGTITREIVQYMSDEEIDALCGQLQRVVTSKNLDEAVEAIRKIDILPKLLIFAWNKRILPANKPEYALSFHARSEDESTRVAKNDEDYLRQILTTSSQDEAIGAIQKFLGARVPQIGAFLAAISGEAIPSEFRLTDTERDQLEKAVRAMIEAPLPSTPGKDQSYNRLRSVVSWFNVKKDLAILEQYGEKVPKPTVREVHTKLELQKIAAVGANNDLEVLVDQFLDLLNKTTYGPAGGKLTRAMLRTQVCLDRTVVVDAEELGPDDTTEVVQVLKLRGKKQQFYIQRELLRNTLIAASSGQDVVLAKALCTHVLKKESTDNLMQDLLEKLQSDKRQASNDFTKALLVTTLDPEVDEQPVNVADEFTKASQELAKSTLGPGIRIMHGVVVPEKLRLTNEQLNNFIKKTQEVIDTLKTEEEGALKKKGLEVAASGFPFLQKVLKEAMPEGYEVHLTEKEAKLCEESLNEGDLSKFLMYACGFIAAPLADKAYVDGLAEKFQLDSVLTRYLPRLLQLSDKDQASGLAESLISDYATIRKVTDIAKATHAMSRDELKTTLESKRESAPIGHRQFADSIVRETKSSLKSSLKPLSSLKGPISLDRFLVQDPESDPGDEVFVIGEFGDQAVYVSWSVLESHINLALLQVCETVEQRLDARFGENLSLDEKAWKAAEALTPTLDGLLDSVEKFQQAGYLKREGYFPNKDKDRNEFARESAQKLLSALLGDELEQLQMPLLVRHLVMELLVGDSIMSKETIETYEDASIKMLLTFIRGGLDGVIAQLDKDKDLPIVTRLIEKKIDARLTDAEYLSGLLHEQLHDIVQTPEFQKFDLPKVIAKTCVTTVFKTLFPVFYPAEKKTKKVPVDPHLRHLVAKTSDVALRQLRPQLANSWLFKMANKLGAVDAAYDSLTLTIQESARTTFEEKLRKAGKTGTMKSGDMFLLVNHLVLEEEDSKEKAPKEATKVSHQQLLVDDITKIYMKGGFISQSKSVGELVKGAIGWSFAETVKGLFLSVPQVCSYALNKTTSGVLSLFSRKTSRSYNQHVTDKVNRFWESAKTSFDHIGHRKAYEKARKDVDHVITVLEEKDLLVHTVTTLLPECIDLVT